MNSSETSTSKHPNDREIWDKAIDEGKKERPVELKVDLVAIRRALRESRWQHTRRVRSHLP